MGRNDIVVGESMDKHERPFEKWCERREVGTCVGIGVGIGMPEVSLGVVGVIETPVGHGGTRHGSVENVGPLQHRKRSQVAAKGPAADANPGEIHEALVLPGQGMKSFDLIVENRVSHIAQDFLFELGATSWRARTIGHDDDKPLVGKPLAGREC